MYFIIDQEEDLGSTKVLNNIRRLEKVINILSEPLGIALFYYIVYLLLTLHTYLKNENVLLLFQIKRKKSNILERF